ncbi:MAG TPA: hypothetical protein VMW35_06610, partial [Myxococcota bacterium]|nr:hypothetical protein [Myxococcota bacterium]
GDRFPIDLLSTYDAKGCAIQLDLSLNDARTSPRPSFKLEHHGSLLLTHWARLPFKQASAARVVGRYHELAIWPGTPQEINRT